MPVDTPPPLAGGGGWGRGRRAGATPSPNPLPQGGGDLRPAAASIIDCNARSTSGTPCPVTPESSMTRRPEAFASAVRRAVASRGVMASTLFNPISSALSASPPP